MLFKTSVSSMFRFSVLALMIVATKGDWGCYNSDSEQCNCDESVCDRASCMDQGDTYFWSGGCGNCVCTCPDKATRTYTVKVDLFFGAFGLYSFEECGDVNPAPALLMAVGETYTFDQTDISNYYHPMGFAYRRDGALTGSTELEPGERAEDSTSDCADKKQCPAPIYSENGVQLGGYTNLLDGSFSENDIDFGLESYEPKFFYPLSDWVANAYTIQLRYTDDTSSQDFFYFCHIHAGMSGRIILTDSDGNEKSSDRIDGTDSYYVNYFLSDYSEFDEECGTYGLDSYKGSTAQCPDEFVCKNGDKTTYASCIDAMNCQMMVGMTSSAGTSVEELFLIQMIPHHANAVQMSKALLKLSGYACNFEEETEEETTECILEGIARSIITNQNFQIQTMVDLYGGFPSLNSVPDFIQETDCNVQFSREPAMIEEQPCFSALTTAFVQGKGCVTMDSVEVGDSVLTGSGEFQSVYSIDHRDFKKLTTFLQIVFGSDNNVLEVTPNHMIFKEGSETPVASVTIKVGDRVVTPNGYEEVNDITIVERKGVFNPLTTDGTIVASGMVASTFSSLISQNEYIEVAGSSIMSYQEFFTNLLKPYKFICTTFSHELCRADSEKVMVSELASRIFFYHNGDSAYQTSLLATVAFILSVMQKIVIPLLYVSVPFSIFKLINAGKNKSA